MKHIFALSCSSLLVASYALPALGATFTVPSAFFPTIQSAVNASGPGDTINVNNGVYFENVVVPPGKNGLRIIGASQTRTIVDARPLGPVGTGPGFLIQSDHVLIKRLTVRHAEFGDFDGDDIFCEADGCTFQFVTTLNAADDGIEIIGNRALVTDCLFVGHDDVGLSIEGDDARVFRNTAKNIGRRGFELIGERHRVESNEALLINRQQNTGVHGGFGVVGDDITLRFNTVSDVFGGGFIVAGTNVLLERNKVNDSFGNDCYEVIGDGARLIENSAKDCRGLDVEHCFQVVGSNATLSGNSAERCFDTAYDVSGESAMVKYNSAEGAGIGYDIQGNLAVIDNNFSADSRDAGFVVIGDNVKTTGNTSVNDETGFVFFNGDNPIIIGNASIDSIFIGFAINCTSSCGSSLVKGNRASGAILDGFNIAMFPGSGAGWIIEANEANGNAGNGMEVSGREGFIRYNRTSGNGAVDDAGIFVSGTLNEISGNVSTANEGEGILVSGNGNTIRNNRTSENILEGIHLDFGSGNMVIANVSFANHADGIRNDGIGTVLRDNRSSNNRPGADCTSDFTGGATLPLVDANNFCADGSSFSTTQSPLIH